MIPIDCVVLPRLTDDQLNEMKERGHIGTYEWMFHDGATNIDREVMSLPPSISEYPTHPGAQLPSLEDVARSWANADEAVLGYQDFLLARDGGLVYELYPYFHGPNPEALYRMVSSGGLADRG